MLGLFVKFPIFLGVLGPWLLGFSMYVMLMGQWCNGSQFFTHLGITLGNQCTCVPVKTHHSVLKSDGPSLSIVWYCVSSGGSSLV